MGIFYRASFQPQPNVQFGQKTNRKIATECERRQLARIEAMLVKARNATDEKDFVATVSEIFKVSRQVVRSRLN